MGLNDEAEKVRQAKAWLENGTPAQRAAALDYLQWRRAKHLESCTNPECTVTYEDDGNLEC